MTYGIALVRIPLFKDTAGPCINILIKLMSMVSIVFAGVIVMYSLNIEHIQPPFSSVKINKQEQNSMQFIDKDKYNKSACNDCELQTPDCFTEEQDPASATPADKVAAPKAVTEKGEKAAVATRP